MGLLDFLKTPLVMGSSAQIQADDAVTQVIAHDTDVTKIIDNDANIANITDEALDVNVKASVLPDDAATETTLAKILKALGGESDVSFTQFGSATVTTGVPTDILTYTVPSGMKFRLTNVRGWADVDGEYYVKINGLQVDGTRTTTAVVTMDINTQAVLSAGESIAVGVTHIITGKPRPFKASIIGIEEAV